MYINTGYLNHSHKDFKDKSRPLIVGSCRTDWMKDALILQRNRMHSLMQLRCVKKKPWKNIWSRNE